VEGGIQDAAYQYAQRMQVKDRKQQTAGGKQQTADRRQLMGVEN
jgi:hypothetical protein